MNRWTQINETFVYKYIFYASQRAFLNKCVCTYCIYSFRVYVEITNRSMETSLLFAVQQTTFHLDLLHCSYHFLTKAFADCTFPYWGQVSCGPLFVGPGPCENRLLAPIATNSARFKTLTPCSQNMMTLIIWHWFKLILSCHQSVVSVNVTSSFRSKASESSKFLVDTVMLRVLTPSSAWENDPSKTKPIKPPAANDDEAVLRQNRSELFDFWRGLDGSSFACVRSLLVLTLTTVR